MIILRDPLDADRLPEGPVRDLVKQRFAEISADEPFDPDTHGYMIVVEPGDTNADLIRETKTPQPEEDEGEGGGSSLALHCEALDEHPFCYELVFIYSDSGWGIDIFLPKAPGIDAGLLDMCRTAATPTNYPLESQKP